MSAVAAPPADPVVAPGAPVAGWAAGPLGAVQEADREIARWTARRARAVAAFAATRPASADRAQGEPGAMSAARWAARPELLREVSEWATAELAVALQLSAAAAQDLLERSLTLVHRLPGTLAALEAGVLHAGHLWPLLGKVAPIAEDAVRARIEALLIGWAAGRVTTPAQLGDKARREIAHRDAAGAADRLARALKGRGVSWRADERTEGMATVTAALGVPEARVLVAALGAYADAVDDPPGGPARSRGEKMADCLLELVLRPGESGLPPVQVLLTVVASLPTLAGGDAPGEVDGQLVPAQMVRALLRALTGLPLPDDAEPAGDGPPDPGAADPDAAPPGAADPGAVAPGGAGAPGGADQTGPAGVAGKTGVPWQQAAQAELEAWWAELELRVLAGALGEQPDHAPDPAPDHAPDPTPGPGPDGGPPNHDAWPQNGRPEDEGRADDGWAEDARAEDAWPDGSDRHGEPSSATPAGGSGDGTTPDTRKPGEDEQGHADGGADDSGWWAAADRAVEEAGQAAYTAQQALGRARAAVRTAARAARATETAWRTGPAGRATAAGDTLTALTALTHDQRAQLGALLAATAGGGLADRPRLALVDALTGALVALTDAPGLRAAAHCGAPACRRTPERCDHDLTARPGLGAPPPTAGHRPSAALDRFVRARDRRCRFPGCRRRVPRGGHLDHNTPWPHGPTTAANLAGYCTTDHRGKHQAPGWTHTLHPDATLTITTPTGLTTTTEPPPY